MGRKGYGAVARGTQGTSSQVAITQTGHGPSSLKYNDLDRRQKNAHRAVQREWFLQGLP